MKKLIFVLIVLVILVGIFFWMGGTKLWQDDPLTYGGKTPAETMELLISALKEGDMELASKYFMPDDSGSIEVWEKNWRQAKADGRLPEIINILERAQPNPSNSIHSGDFKYIIRGENGIIDVTIDLELLDETGVWKVESL